MAGDDDIAAHLPEPPPPAPLPRQRAIDEAMRRFDAAQGLEVVGQPPAPSLGEPWWRRVGRPQTAALVTVGLVALLGVPAAWLSVSQKSAPISRPQLARADTAQPFEPRPTVEQATDAAAHQAPPASCG